MDSLAGLTKAPIFLESDGKEYELSPMTPRDLGFVSKQLALISIREAENMLRELGDTIGVEERIEIVKESRTRSRAMRNMANPEAQEVLETIEGVQLMLWVCLRTKHPGITKEQAGEIMSFKNLQVIVDLVDSASGYEKSEEDIEQEK